MERMALRFLPTRRSRRTAPRALATLPHGCGALDLFVQDPVGLPLPGARTKLTGPDGREATRGRTDPNGIFTATLPPGSYQLSVAAEGFEPLRTSVLVEQDERTTLPPATMDVAPAPRLPQPGEWRIDPAHTSVRFIARHIGLAEVHGRFNAFEGRLLVGPDPQQSFMEVAIEAASIDTNVPARDNHLRSSDFLDAANYPYLHFASERFVHRGGSRWTVQGVLNLHGVSRNVQLDTRYLGVGTGMEGELRTACAASTELHREDFTLNWRKMLEAGIAVVGATIRIELDVQCVQAAAVR